MKKAFSALSAIIAILAIILGTTISLWACDACSGSISTFSPNQTFLQKSHSISFNTDIRLYDVTLQEGLWPGFNNTPHEDHGHTHDSGSDIYYQEKHFSYNITGVYYPTKKLSITAVLPYNHNILLQEGVVLDKLSGVGDVSLLTQYHIINGLGENEDTVKVIHRLTLGAGIKLPTGRFNIEGYEEDIEPYLQPGSGSVDFPFSMQYLMMVKGFGLAPVFSFKLNTTNRNGFKFANTINSKLTFFYSKTVKKFNITPSAGLNLDHGGKAKINAVAYGKDTGGNLLTTFYGVDMSFKNIGVNFAYFQPVYQSLIGDQFENKHSFTASLRYVFKKKNAGTDMQTMTDN